MLHWGLEVGAKRSDWDCRSTQSDSITARQVVGRSEKPILCLPYFLTGSNVIIWNWTAIELVQSPPHLIIPVDG